MPNSSLMVSSRRIGKGYVCVVTLMIRLFRVIPDRDPAGDFLDPVTQKLLKSMTRLRLDKVYRKRVVLNNKVEYKFMTTEQIEDEVRASISKAEALLQMPPIIQVRMLKTTAISHF